MLGLAGEHGADDHLLDTCCLYCLALRLANLLTGSDDEVALCVVDIVYRDTTEDTLGEGSDDAVAILDSTGSKTT
jgi:hypothetical protein